MNLVDVMGVTGVDGVFRIACEETLRVLRSDNKIILMILEVFRHDPLYRWSASERRQEKDIADGRIPSSYESARGNKEAARALLGYAY
jgi:phosphatidylinositol kinase/protein kinase (PI-3  family)